MNKKNNLHNQVSNQAHYEHVNHPKHYNYYPIETIDMMKAIWGDYLTAMWCLMTAFKYRMRMGTKPNNPIQQDIDKESWYLKQYDSLINNYKNNSINN